MNRRGAIGEGILAIYRILMVIAIAFVVLGASVVVYGYYIDVRSVEAVIMVKNVVNCLEPQGNLDLSLIAPSSENKILDYCGIKNTGRFYVLVNISDNGKEFKILQQGDSGAMWVREVFERDYFDKTSAMGSIKQYQAGFYQDDFPVLIDGKQYNLNVRVLVNVE